MAATVEKQLENIITAQERAEKSIAYVFAIKMDVQHIEGTRYKFRLSEQEPER